MLPTSYVHTLSIHNPSLHLNNPHMYVHIQDLLIFCLDSLLLLLVFFSLNISFQGCLTLQPNNKCKPEPSTGRKVNQKTTHPASAMMKSLVKKSVVPGSGESKRFVMGQNCVFLDVISYQT